MPTETETIKKIFDEQKKGNFETCPRCGRKTMRNVLIYNCLSRRADVYVCEICGADEAIRDMRGDEDKLADWHAIRMTDSCNDSK